METKESNNCDNYWKKARGECSFFLGEQSQQEASMTRESVFIEDHSLYVLGDGYCLSISIAV